MSIELPEAKILADQMDKELRGKRVKSYHLKDIERLQRVGLLNKDTTAFKRLVDGEIQHVASRGNVIRVQLDNGMNLILGLEYGGKILYHTTEKKAHKEFHLKIDFCDETFLTVRLTSMGHFSALKDENLEHSYVYRRDFNPEVPSPLDTEFTLDRFSKLLAENSRMLKSVLVGKDAVLVGLSNSAFQDILYRAGLHPKRRATELTADEKQALYDAINLVLQERIRLRGKTQFSDIYGAQGEYSPAMGPNMKEQTCQRCGTLIEKLSVGGGHVYLCPSCQV